MNTPWRSRLLVEVRASTTTMKGDAYGEDDESPSCRFRRRPGRSAEVLHRGTRSRSAPTPRCRPAPDWSRSCRRLGRGHRAVPARQRDPDRDSNGHHRRHEAHDRIRESGVTLHDDEVLHFDGMPRCSRSPTGTATDRLSVRVRRRGVAASHPTIGTNRRREPRPSKPSSSADARSRC